MDLETQKKIDDIWAILDATAVQGKEYDRRFQKDMEAAKRRTEASERRMEASDRRTEASERRMDAFDRRTEASERRMEAFDRRMEASERRMEAFDRRMEASDRRFEKRMQTADERFKQRMAAADQRMDKFEKQLQATRKLVEAGIKLVSTLAADTRELKRSQKAFLDSFRNGSNGSRHRS